MIRETLTPRPDWQAKVEALGLVWHTADGRPYWDEAACYRFTAAQVAEIEAATAELYRLFLAAGQVVIGEDLLGQFGIPHYCHQAIRDAWDAEPPALNFGRFDLGYDGKSPLKLFEFNCDTPTSLLEAAVVQWAWKEEVRPAADQFNSLHERLVAKWADIRPDAADAPLHVTHMADDAGEDTVTVAYLRDTAAEAGIETIPVLIDDIGWDTVRRRFVDLNGRPIDAIFHLYPWEWLMADEFGRHLIESLPVTIWIEPIWKMIWSNKAILPVLWELFPDHPNLLPADWDALDGDCVAKPMLAREGANVSIRRSGAVVAESDGGYGAGGYVYQALYTLPEAAPGCFPVIGSWVIDGQPAGMGIREDGLITGNGARFVPHIVCD